MSMQNQTTVPPMPWPNILEDILVVPSPQLYALIITMKNCHIPLQSPRRREAYCQNNSGDGIHSAFHPTHPGKTLQNKSATMVSMHEQRNKTKILIPPFPEKSIKSFCPSTAGVIAYCIPSAMILSNVLVAVRLWCFWKYMIIISIILWTKCTKG